MTAPDDRPRSMLGTLGAAIGWISSQRMIWVPLAVIAILVALRTFWVEAFKIPAPSMAPTLLVGDHIFVRKAAYGWFERRAPDRGDVVVFRFPERREQDFVKRVVGVPGDRILVRNRALYINGWAVPTCAAGKLSTQFPEPETHGDLVVEFLGDHAYLIFHDDQWGTQQDEEGPFEVAEGQVFVMGDNRENSHDSRRWFEGRGGGVPIVDVKGRASSIWMSFSPHGIRWPRVGLALGDAPPCRETFPPATCAGIERCLANRPPRTTPPRP